MTGRAKDAIRQLAYLTGYSKRRALARRCVRFLMFHDVGDPSYPLTLFGTQLEYLSRSFEVCALPEAILRLRNDAMQGDEIVLTFDDGLENHATRVYPMLRRLRLPASFFVCPGLVDSEEGIWTLETRARLAALPQARVDAWRREVGAPAAGGVESVIEWMKSLPVEACRRIVAALHGVVRSEVGGGGQRPTQRLMSWEQLRGLDPDLITIGSHSLSHPMLPRLDAPELEREVTESRLLLEKQLKRKCPFFCYPDGAHDSRVIELARRHYDAALTATDGYALPSDDLFTLPRLAAARSLPRLAWQLGASPTPW